MKDLTFPILRKAVKFDVEGTLVLCCRKAELGTVETEEVQLPNACFVDFSTNHFTVLPNIWDRFPLAWWVQFSQNNVTVVDPSQLPAALGLLDLSLNNCDASSLLSLSKCHILRLNLFGNPVYGQKEGIDVYCKEIRSMVLSKLVNVWVLDDDYVSALERNSLGTLKNPELSAEMSLRSLSEREENLLLAMQEIPRLMAAADHYRLQILLEDYLEYVRIYNKHGHNRLSLPGSKLSGVNLFSLMSLSHRLKIDLSVLLTASILFPLPLNIFRDAMVHLLTAEMPGEEIRSLVNLPMFVRTAICSLLRRICKREIEELEVLGVYSIKPTLEDFPNYPLLSDNLNVSEPPPPHFRHQDGGFLHLAPVLSFLTRPLERYGPVANVTKAVHSPYSELELEILQTLPDCPTRSTRPPDGSTSYRDWVCLCARHAVLLLKKAPCCPLLTKAQTTRQNQELYNELLPILRTAGLTYLDLDIALTGEGKDGRVVAKKRKSAKEVNALSVGGNVLAFGVGIPSAGPSSLTWNAYGVVSRYAASSDAVVGRSVPAASAPVAAAVIATTSTEQLHMNSSSSAVITQVEPSLDACTEVNEEMQAADGELDVNCEPDEEKSASDQPYDFAEVVGDVLALARSGKMISTSRPLSPGNNDNFELSQSVSESAGAKEVPKLKVPLKMPASSPFTGGLSNAEETSLVGRSVSGVGLKSNDFVGWDLDLSGRRSRPVTPPAVLRIRTPTQQDMMLGNPVSVSGAHQGVRPTRDNIPFSVSLPSRPSSPQTIGRIPSVPLTMDDVLTPVHQDVSSRPPELHVEMDALESSLSTTRKKSLGQPEETASPPGPISSEPFPVDRENSFKTDEFLRFEEQEAVVVTETLSSIQLPMQSSSPAKQGRPSGIVAYCDEATWQSAFLLGPQGRVESNWTPINEIPVLLHPASKDHSIRLSRNVDARQRNEFEERKSHVPDPSSKLAPVSEKSGALLEIKIGNDDSSLKEPSESSQDYVPLRMISEKSTTFPPMGEIVQSEHVQEMDRCIITDVIEEENDDDLLSVKSDSNSITFINEGRVIEVLGIEPNLPGLTVTATHLKKTGVILPNEKFAGRVRSLRKATKAAGSPLANDGVDSVNTESSAEAARRLLAEMGTLRNFRELREYSLEKAEAAVKEKLNRFMGGVLDENKDSDSVVLTRIEPGKQAQIYDVVPTRFSFSLDQKYQATRLMDVNLSDSNAFLTGVHLQETEDYDQLDGGSSRFDDVDRAFISEDVTVASSAGFGSVQSEEYQPINAKQHQEESGIPATGRYVPVIASPVIPTKKNNSLPATQLLRMQSNYSKIYTYNEEIAYAQRAVNGKKLNTTFYPRFGKFMHVLRPDAVPMAISQATLKFRQGQAKPATTLSPPVQGLPTDDLRSSRRKADDRSRIVNKSQRLREEQLQNMSPSVTAALLVTSSNPPAQTLSNKSNKSSSSRRSPLPMNVVNPGSRPLSPRIPSVTVSSSDIIGSVAESASQYSPTNEKASHHTDESFSLESHPTTPLGSGGKRHFSPRSREEKVSPDHEVVEETEVEDAEVAESRPSSDDMKMTFSTRLAIKSPSYLSRKKTDPLANVGDDESQARSRSPTKQCEDDELSAVFQSLSDLGGREDDERSLGAYDMVRQDEDNSSHSSKKSSKKSDNRVKERNVSFHEDNTDNAGLVEAAEIPDDFRDAASRQMTAMTDRTEFEMPVVSPCPKYKFDCAEFGEAGSVKSTQILLASKSFRVVSPRNSSPLGMPTMDIGSIPWQSQKSAVDLSVSQRSRSQPRKVSPSIRSRSPTPRSARRNIRSPVGNKTGKESSDFIPHAAATAVLPLNASFSLTVGKSGRLPPACTISAQQLPLPPLSARSRARKIIESGLHGRNLSDPYKSLPCEKKKVLTALERRKESVRKAQRRRSQGSLAAIKNDLNLIPNSSKTMPPDTANTLEHLASLWSQSLANSIDLPPQQVATTIVDLFLKGPSPLGPVASQSLTVLTDRSSAQPSLTDYQMSPNFLGAQRRKLSTAFEFQDSTMEDSGVLQIPSKSFADAVAAGILEDASPEALTDRLESAANSIDQAVLTDDVADTAPDSPAMALEFLPKQDSLPRLEIPQLSSRGPEYK